MVAIGITDAARIAVVIYYIDRKGRIEIFKARKATQKEWARYGLR